MIEEMLQWVQPEKIIAFGGLWILVAMVFIETGIFFGFFFPGDSLLFTAGLLCSMGILKVSLVVLLLSLIVASFAGSWVGYISGKYIIEFRKGKKDNFFFRRRYLVKTRQFYRTYGGSAMILGKFLPIIRTFLPILAGMVRISLGRFLLLNSIGSVLWVVLMIGSGYYLGKFFPGIYNYLEWVIIGIILITLLPFLGSLFRRKVVKVNVKPGQYV